MVKPKPISESAVRITDISVRSALMRVRWNDMPVRRAARSVFTSNLRSGLAIVLSVTGGSIGRGPGDPPIGDALEGAAQKQIRDKCQENRNNRRLARVERVQDPPLIND